VSEAENQVFVRGRVPESLRARFKATCALEGRDMSDVLRELIEGWLEENEKSSPAKKGKRDK
jgi:predicted DNA-binding protein